MKGSRIREQYGRVVLAMADLSEATDSVVRLLELDEFDKPTVHHSPDFRAHLVCFVVSYARPFTKNRPGSEVGVRIGSAAIETFTPAERRLHQRFLELRHREFAHSDGDVADMDIRIVEHHGTRIGVPISRVLRIGISRSDIETAKVMLGKLGVWISVQTETLPNLISPDEVVDWEGFDG